MFKSLLILLLSSVCIGCDDMLDEYNCDYTEYKSKDTGFTSSSFFENHIRYKHTDYLGDNNNPTDNGYVEYLASKNDSLSIYELAEIITGTSGIKTNVDPDILEAALLKLSLYLINSSDTELNQLRNIINDFFCKDISIEISNITNKSQFKDVAHDILNLIAGKTLNFNQPDIPGTIFAKSAGNNEYRNIFSSASFYDQKSKTASSSIFREKEDKELLTNHKYIQPTFPNHRKSLNHKYVSLSELLPTEQNLSDDKLIKHYQNELWTDSPNLLQSSQINAMLNFARMAKLYNINVECKFSNGTTSISMTSKHPEKTKDHDFCARLIRIVEWLNICKLNNCAKALHKMLEDEYEKSGQYRGRYEYHIDFNVNKRLPMR
ncbi:MAG: hypothetical protein IJ481_01470 [Alphaproteobacteria bacterium]|nr:hypothetical protein [Alphaproteobacteria bacterium]